MKSIIKIYIVAIFFLSLHQNAYAQTSEKKNTSCSFKVEGVCGMCKARIEKAAMIPGVKMANWDKSTGVLKVYYREDKVSQEKVHQAVAQAGHKTESIDADSTAYQELPYCCQYNSGSKKH